MPRYLSQEQKDQLEALVDSASLSAVLVALAEVAAEKAEHLRSNWQDAVSARTWDAASRKVDSLSMRLVV